jgi:hypothetical protein
LARLTSVSWPELVKRLKRLGLEGPYYGTKHPYMMKGDKTVILPNPHHGEDISVDFLGPLLALFQDSAISCA